MVYQLFNLLNFIINDFDKKKFKAPKKVELKQDMKIKGDLLIQGRHAKNNAEIHRDGLFIFEQQ